MTKVADKEEFLRLHNLGYTNRELADLFGITIRHATRMRSTLGVAQPANPKTRWRATPEWRAKVEQLYTEGHSTADIARTTGTSPQTLRRHFPGKSWDPKTIGEYGNAVRKANRDLVKAGFGKFDPLPRAT